MFREIKFKSDGSVVVVKDYEDQARTPEARTPNNGTGTSPTTTRRTGYDWLKRSDTGEVRERELSRYERRLEERQAGMTRGNMGPLEWM